MRAWKLTKYSFRVESKNMSCALKFIGRLKHSLSLAIAAAIIFSTVGSCPLIASDLPPIRRLTAPIEMRLSPGYSVTCTKTQEVVGQSSVGPIEMGVAKSRIERKGGQDTYTVSADLRGGVSLLVIATIDKQGALRDVSTRIDAEGLGKPAKDALEKFATDSLIGGSIGPIELRQGLKLPWKEMLRGMMSSFANYAPDARLETSPGAVYKLVGITTLDNEDFAVFEFDGRMKLIIDRSNIVKFELMGHQLVHIASGLQFDNVSTSKVMGDNQTIEMIERNRCSLEVMEQYFHDEGSPSDEGGTRERLQAIKSLLDDGLISQEEAAALRERVLSEF